MSTWTCLADVVLFSQTAVEPPSVVPAALRVVVGRRRWKVYRWIWGIELLPEPLSAISCQSMTKSQRLVQPLLPERVRAQMKAISPSHCITSSFFAALCKLEPGTSGFRKGSLKVLVVFLPCDLEV